MRKKRDWLQGKLAQIMGKPQSTVSRFESEDYGKWTLETLLEISDAFDVGLIVEFVSYPEFMIRTSDLSYERLAASEFSEKSVAFLRQAKPNISAFTHRVDAVSSSGITVQPSIGLKSFTTSATGVVEPWTSPSEIWTTVNV